ncbi:type II toxin-antitoxin system death-on-curing family toxin [Anaerohalosphaeraceae bacterium U12dextr]|jgi:death-on-curing protein
MDIVFLDFDDVAAIHADQISRYGGSAGLRNQGLLESAVMMPQASFAGQYAHEDLYMMAATYLYHIAMNHPFVDGNKRTGTVCAIVFLELNGIHVKPDNDALVDFVLAVAQGQKDKSQIAAFFKEHSEPLP